MRGRLRVAVTAIADSSRVKAVPGEAAGVVAERLAGACVGKEQVRGPPPLELEVGKRCPRLQQLLVGVLITGKLRNTVQRSVGRAPLAPLPPSRVRFWHYSALKVRQLHNHRHRHLADAASTAPSLLRHSLLRHRNKSPSGWCASITFSVCAVCWVQKCFLIAAPLSAAGWGGRALCTARSAESPSSCRHRITRGNSCTYAYGAELRPSGLLGPRSLCGPVNGEVLDPRRMDFNGLASGLVSKVNETIVGASSCAQMLAV